MQTQNHKLLLVALMSVGVMACSDPKKDEDNTPAHNSSPSAYYSENGLMYFGDKQIQPRYTDGYSFDNGATQVADLNAKWGVIDSYGKTLIAHDYNQMWSASKQDFYIGVKNKDWQFLKTDGTPLFAETFRRAYSFVEDMSRVNKDGKWFFIDDKGKHIADGAGYSYAYDFSNGFAIVRKDGKEGYIDKDGNVLGNKLDYAYAYNFEKNKTATVVTTAGKEQLINDQGDALGTFEMLYAFADGDDAWAVARQDGKYGFIDKNAQWKISHIYKSLGNFAKNGLALAKDVNGKWGYIDKENNAKLAFNYKDANNFNDEGFATVQTADGKWGVIDKDGAFKVAAQYDYIYGADESTGIAVLEKGAKQGLINLKTAKVVVEPKYAEVWNSGYKMFGYKQDGKYGYLNLEGNEVVPAQYEAAAGFKQRRAVVKKDGKYGVLLRGKGETKVVPKYAELGEIGENYLIAAKNDGKWGYVSSVDGSVVVPFEYDKAAPFAYSGLAMVAKDGKYGFINPKNTAIIALQYADAGNFNRSGLAPVKKDGKWGYIDSSNNTVIDFKYTNAQSFGELASGAIVVDSTGSHLITSIGETVFTYPELKPYQADTDSNIIAFKDNNDKWGYVNTRGRVRIKAQYDEVSAFVGGMAAVKKAGKWQYINTLGEALFADAEFDTAEPRTKGQICFEVKNDGDTYKINYSGEKSEFCNAK